MCGIVGYIGHKCAYCLLLESLYLLQNRGYDSAGITVNKNIIISKSDTINQNKTQIIHKKFVSHPKNSALTQLKQSSNCKGNECNSETKFISQSGIGHTRWATHGSKTVNNAHPHVFNNIHVVHNGIIENYEELKKKCIESEFKSETDTEVISALFSNYVSSGMDSYKAWEKTNNDLEGSWALCAIIESEPNIIYISKKGSPLLVGFNNDGNNNEVFIASESDAFHKYTSKWFIMGDGEVLKILKTSSGILIQKGDNVVPIEEFVPHDIHIVEQKVVLKTPDPYKYWTEKEIYDQTTSLWDTLNRGGRFQSDYSLENKQSCIKLGGLDNHKNILLQVDHLVIVGCGTSLHAGMFGAKLIKEISKFETVQVIDASEFLLEDLPSKGKVGIVFISQSGETKDCHRILQQVNNVNTNVCVTVGIINVTGSLIARETDCGIYLNAGKECGVASTKSFTSQIIALCLFALWFAQNRGCLHTRLQHHLNNIKMIPSQFRKHMEYMKHCSLDLVIILKTSNSTFILGKSYAYCIALEGALKIKELAYRNVNGYPSGGLKHGPFALICKGTPIFLHIYNDKFKSRMLSCAEEIKSRGAFVIAVTNDNSIKVSKCIDYVVSIDNESSLYASLISVLLYQWIAFNFSVMLGYNPDFPRNLAKVVTVDG